MKTDLVSRIEYQVIKKKNSDERDFSVHFPLISKLLQGGNPFFKMRVFRKFFLMKKVSYDYLSNFKINSNHKIDYRTFDP